jgi:hypothetical protein
LGSASVVGLARRHQPFGSEQPDGFQQPMAAFAGGLELDRALVDQSGQGVIDVEDAQVGGAVHGGDRCLRGRQAEPPGEDGQPPKHQVLARVEQVVAPLHGPPQGLMPLDGSPAAAHQQTERLIQPDLHLRDRHRPQPGRCQFQREGDAVQSPADGTHGSGGIGVQHQRHAGLGRPGAQQPCGWGGDQRRTRLLLSASTSLQEEPLKLQA